MNASVPLPDEARSYTYGDYVTWAGEERWEIIEGVAYAMTPGPGRRHQEVSGELFAQIHSCLRDKPCRVYAAPFDVRLPEGEDREEDVRTVVQPDLSVYCDPSALDERGGRGRPEWVIEIVSPGSAARDLTVKLNLYEKHRVPEYWVVHPVDRLVMVFHLIGGKGYARPVVYGAQDRARVGIFPDLEIDLKPVFSE